MGLLSGAIREQKARESSVKSDYGSYRAFFVGMSDKYEWTSPFGDQCRMCKGGGKGYQERGECRSCKGSGVKTETRVKLLYDLENGNREEEEVNFSLAPPGVAKDGTTLSASKLFKRMRTFSRKREANEVDLDMWYSSLPTPIKIPITVNIGDNNGGTALIITDVMFRETSGRPADYEADRAARRPTSEPAQRQRETEAQHAPQGSFASDSGAFDDEVPF